MKKNVMLLLLFFCVIGIMIIGCAKKETPDTLSPVPSKTEEPARGPELPEDITVLFKGLEKFSPEDDFFFEKEFEAVREKSDEYSEKKDKAFIEALFYQAEHGKGVEKKACNELLCHVISTYAGEDWDDHVAYRERAIKVIGTSDDKDFRKGCWGFLTYYYEPETITPELLKIYKETDNKELKMEILDEIGGPAKGAFIEKNEEALNEICLAVLNDNEASAEMKVNAIEILEESGNNNEDVKKKLEALKASSDEEVKDAAKEALEDMSKK